MVNRTWEAGIGDLLVPRKADRLLKRTSIKWPLWRVNLRPLVAYSLQHTAGPRTFAFAAGMGMDGNHGNSTCTHQHLASQRNSIYSTISTLHFQLLPCTWTLDATNMFEVLTDSVQSNFLLLFFYLQVPHLPDLGRHSMWGDGGTTIQQ